MFNWSEKKHIAEFNTRGFTVVRNLYNPENHTKKNPNLFTYVLNLPKAPGDEQSPKAPAYYGETEIKKLQVRLLPLMEKYTGLKLYPTFNYMRIYKEDSILPPHVDRGSCEISCTFTIGYTGNYNWPIFIKDLLGDTHQVSLEPGDGLLYRGADLLHWREPADGQVSCQAQAFIHYVDQAGPYEDYVFDVKTPNPNRRTT